MPDLRSAWKSWIAAASRRFTAFASRKRAPGAWKKPAAYAAFALVAFVFALRQTFPADAVVERLVLESAAQGWQLRVADAGPAGLVGVRMDGVTLESSDGARIPVEQLTAKVRILPLLLGRRGVDFDASLYAGRVRGTAEESRRERRLTAKIDAVDLGRAAAMRKLVSVDLAGIVNGDVDLALDLREPAKSSGHVDLSVAQAALRGGEVPIAALGGGALTLPRVGVGTIAAHAAVKDGKATFDTLSAKGEDLEADAKGLYVVVQPRLAQAPIFGRAHLRFNDALWQKPDAAKLRGVLDLALAPGKAPDGSYGFQVYGTVSNPQARAAPL